MEADLRINLAKYSTLFDLLPLGVTMSDQNGQIIESNQEAIHSWVFLKKNKKAGKLGGEQWAIVRPDKTPMPPEEYASLRAMKENRRVENIEMASSRVRIKSPGSA